MVDDDGKALGYGETPWDHMSREELLCEIWRMYSALVSVTSTVRITKAANPNSVYWSQLGRAGPT
jgi:hypothetical protein